MCLTIVEILLLVAGLWLIITGKVPEKLFTVLFGKGEYPLTSTQARLFGLLLALPFPLSFVISFVVIILFGPDSTGNAMFIETLIGILVIIAVVIIVRRIRKPIVNEPPQEN